MSGLVDPVYALGNVTGFPTRVVVRDMTKESTVNVAVAIFAQVYHSRYSWLSPLSFVAGAAIGPVQTLPAGVSRARGDRHELSV